MLETLLTQKLRNDYQEAGFSLSEPDDHILALLRYGSPIAKFLSTRVTFSEIEAEIERTLNG